MCLGIPAQVVEVLNDDFHLATVEVAGVRRIVNVGLLTDDGDGVQPGDWVLVHVSLALNRLDEAEAAATLKFLRELGQAYQDELAVLQEPPAP